MPDSNALIPSVSRRRFVRTGATVAAGGVLVPGALRATGPSGQSDPSDTALRHDTARAADPDFVRTVALAAVDAARSAGATYADVRLTRFVEQAVGPLDGQAGIRAYNSVRETEQHGIGVRVLVNGAWGFAASPYWTVGEAARLAQDATAQARENAQVMTTRRELAPMLVTTGTWQTPHEIDPFSVSLEEKLAFVENVASVMPYRAIDHERLAYLDEPIVMRRGESTLATTEGTFVTQRRYVTETAVRGAAQFTGWAVHDGARWWRDAQRLHGHYMDSIRVRVRGAGWETVRDLPVLARQLKDDAYRALTSTASGNASSYKPVSVGRFTIVADATSVGALLGTAVQAMDLARILGKEANGVGTSWLGSDPLALLGHFDFGSPLLSVMADRSLANGPGMTKWDDEGVEATAFPLVERGILRDFPTTRDTAMALGSAYQRLGRSVRSNGCSVSMSAFEQPLLGTPDVIMTPGKEDLGFEQLVASVTRGYALVGLRPGEVETDMQLRSLVAFRRYGTPILREIVNGRLGAFVTAGAILIDAPQLWKNLVAVGGRSSLDPWAGADYPVNEVTYKKGQPLQLLVMGVKAVPGIFTDLAIVDAQRNV